MGFPFLWQRSLYTQEALALDVDRFDALVHAIGNMASRRAALGGALGAIFVVLAARLGIDNAAARKKRKKRKCKGGRKRCGRKCILKTECCRGCSGGLQCCNGACKDLLSDGVNCGGCGIVCETGECVHGACTCASSDDCPGSGCTCSSRLEGGAACRGPLLSSTPCDGDETCPLATFCTFGSELCSEQCVA